MKNKFLNNIGYTALEILIVISMVGVVPITVYIEAQKAAQTASCMSNLRNIYIGVQMYELDFGRLPDAEFYPKSPKTDPKSIVNLLKSQIDDNMVYLCPVMPDELKKTGLTYIWNDSYNNKSLYHVKSQSLTWMMTNMTAVEPKIPPPHHGCYNVLFFDGHVDTMKEAVYFSPTTAELEKITPLLVKQVNPVKE